MYTNLFRKPFLLSYIVLTKLRESENDKPRKTFTPESYNRLKAEGCSYETTTTCNIQNSKVE